MSDQNTAFSNLFSEIFSWDIYLQGLFFLSIVIVSILFLFIDIIDAKNFFINFIKKNISFINGDIPDRIVKFISLSTITVSISAISIFFIFSSGIIVKHLADDFIDSDKYYHLWQKPFWVQSFSGNYKSTDKNLKLYYFDKIFPEEYYPDIKESSKLEIYYYAKHQILNHDKWKSYLAYSQNLVNSLQVFSLSFYIVIIISLFKLFLMCIESFVIFLDKDIESKEKKISFKFFCFLLYLTFILLDCRNFFHSHLSFLFCGSFILFCLSMRYYKEIESDISITVIILFLSISGYYSSSISWVSSEAEVDSQVYGIFKFVNNNSLKHKEINNVFINGVDEIKDIDRGLDP